MLQLPLQLHGQELASCVVLQDAYQARLMFGDALLSAVNMGQILHAAENQEDADKLKNKVGSHD